MARVTVQPSTPMALGSGGARVRSSAAAARWDGWLRRLPLLPALVYVILVTQVPFALTIVYSLQKWNLLYPAPARFTGLQNYIDVINDPSTRTAIWNTIVLTVCAVSLSVAIGVGIAMLLGRADWINQYPMASIVGIEVWRWTPFMMLIVLAGLQSQNQEVLEAARVDGARALQMFRYITLPFIRPFIELGALLGALFIVQSFDTIFMTTQGGPGEATTNLPFLLYLVAFQGFDIGKASAIGVLAVVLTMIVATFALRTLFTIFRVEARR